MADFVKCNKCVHCRLKFNWRALDDGGVKDKMLESACVADAEDCLDPVRGQPAMRGVKNCYAKNPDGKCEDFEGKFKPGVVQSAPEKPEPVQKPFRRNKGVRGISGNL